MNHPHDPYGQHGYGAPPPHGYPPEPEPKSQAALIIGLIAGFAIVLLLTLWATGALDRMFSSATPTVSPTVAAASPAATPAPAAAPAAAAAPAPATAAAPAPTPAPVVDNNWIVGRWCDASGDTVTFDAATQQAIVVSGGTTDTYGYDLDGSRLMLQGPAGAVRASVTQNGSSDFDLSMPGQPRESYTRC